MTQNLNENVSNQVNRMKAMMNYGMKTESRPYNSVEFERVGADGKKYAIIREGSKFHIKVSDKKNPAKSDYDYINGFVNHRQNMFESYANALKHFEMKMTSLNEAYNKKGNVETWNVNGRDEVLAEASNKMRLEIARQREIMKNAAIISEGKNGVDKTQASNIEKNNIRMTKPKTGEATGQGGDIFDEKPEKEMLDMQKDNIKGKQQPVVENAENEFMDGPSINVASNNQGDGAGQTNVMGGGMNGLGGGSGAGSLGEDEDEDELSAEDEFDGEDDDFSGEIDTDDAVEDFDSEGEELEEFPEEDEEEFEDDSITAQNEEEDSDVASLRAEIDSLRSTIDAIASKLGVNEFDEDEPLYDDDVEDDAEAEDADDEFDAETEDEKDFDAEGDDFEGDTEDEEDDDDVEVYESVNYRKVMAEGKKMDALKKTAKKVANKVGTKLRHAYEDYQDSNEIGLHTPNWMNATDEDWEEHEKFAKAVKDRRKAKRDAENKKKDVNETVLHDFGKHPRFKKEPMTYSTPNMQKKEGQYEEGADEDNTNKPYATEIGDPTPFGDGEKVKKVVNSIAEQVMRKLKLKND